MKTIENIISDLDLRINTLSKNNASFIKQRRTFNNIQKILLLLNNHYDFIYCHDSDCCLYRENRNEANPSLDYRIIVDLQDLSPIFSTLNENGIEYCPETLWATLESIKLSFRETNP